MRLKKLELIGFKSFADRAGFEFEGSLTGLVGPNGSGKSNVVDALKWVLGEQSARRLRGAEMADMIFSGSASRKALGAAEVRVTLVNDRGLLPEEYGEVRISRRCYRSGESDYQINGRACRLKDVRTLLMDTGAGVSAYSVIEQGQVDGLLRANSKERRLVFEEAAGISRYLDQKKEAERKLERVRANLERVGDIIEELERQLRSVRYQAAKARRFKRHTEELRTLRLALATRERAELTARRGENAASMAESEDALAVLEARAQECKKDLAAEREALDERRLALSRDEEGLGRLDARHYGLGREIEINERNHVALESRVGDLLRRATEAAAQVDGLRSELAAAEERLGTERAALDQKRREFEDGQAGLRDAERRLSEQARHIDAEKSAVFEMMQNESQLQNQAGMFRAEQDALTARIGRQAERAEHIAGQIERTGAEISVAEADRAKALGELAKVRDEMAGVENELSEATGRLERVTSSIGDLKADINGAVSRRQLLRDLEDRAEGVGSGVKVICDAIASEGSALAGAPGILAGLVRTATSNALAVEAALGHRVQSIVVETREQAREAMRMLRTGRRGRAEVLALEGLDAPCRAVPPSIACVRLTDLVEYSEPVAAVVEALLGNCFVVDSAEEALEALDAGVPAGVRIVTRNGECFEAGGAWAAGEPEAGSLISRRSELAELDEQIAALEAQLSALTNEGADWTARIQDLQRSRSRVGAKKDALTTAENDVQRRLSLLSSHQERHGEELELVQTEEASLRRDVDGIRKRSAGVSEELEEVKTRRVARQSATDDAQRELAREREAHEARAGDVSDLARIVARMEEQQNGLRSLVDRLGEQVRDRAIEAERMTLEQKQTVEQLREAAERIAAACRERDEVAREREVLRGRIQSLTAQCEAGRADLSRMQAQLDDFESARHAAEKALNELRMAEGELRLKLENADERMRDECGVHVDRLALDPDAWREASPFTTLEIAEYRMPEPEDAPGGAPEWYAESVESADTDGTDGTDPGLSLITLAEAVELRNSVLGVVESDETDWGVVRTRAEKLRKEVERMGGANLDSIREQDELEVRAEFLARQREDLENARRHELEIIRKLSKQSREQFAETFRIVRENFQAIVRKLFGGGTGDLILDPEVDDVLEAGIDIVVRPPGKENRSITLLSGGEKALTAVSLLLAIFKTKPSPFCVLDEVDAPLDEANIGRFLALLDDYRRDTQFIIVTHNKLTMSAAETLYGVSLQEDGVSQRLSVNFEEIDRRLEEMSVETRESLRIAKAG